MTWLKLTKKALYLMQGGSNQYLQKVALQPHNPDLEQFRFAVPVEWLQSLNPPHSMIIALEGAEPQPVPQSAQLSTKVQQVIPTQEWGAESPRETFERTTPLYIVIHHSDQRNPPHDFSQGTEEGAKQWARSLQKDHFYGRGWPDLSHHFLNTTGGLILEGRHGSLDAVSQGQSVQSDHANSDPELLSGGNESLGIENEGNFNQFEMVEQQWDSLVELCVFLCHSCKIPPEHIKGHRDFSYTHCPGDWLYSQLPRLREEVQEKLLLMN